MKPGELEGFDVDIASELAKRLELSLNLIDISPEMLMASVRTKKIDCMLAPMAITPERERPITCLIVAK
jgi:ABC-type amino acid transport substrate-binding protein